jgi:hypothetical protein
VSHKGVFDGSRVTAFNAPRHGIELEGIEIKISCNLDPSVLFEVKGPESHTTCTSKITAEVKVKGNLTDEQLKTVERLVHHSPVFGLIEYAHKVKSRVRRGPVWRAAPIRSVRSKPD